MIKKLLMGISVGGLLMACAPQPDLQPFAQLSGVMRSEAAMQNQAMLRVVQGHRERLVKTVPYGIGTAQEITDSDTRLALLAQATRDTDQALAAVEFYAAELYKLSNARDLGRDAARRIAGHAHAKFGPIMGAATPFGVGAATLILAELGGHATQIEANQDMVRIMDRMDQLMMAFAIGFDAHLANSDKVLNELQIAHDNYVIAITDSIALEKVGAYLDGPAATAEPGAMTIMARDLMPLYLTRARMMQTEGLAEAQFAKWVAAEKARNQKLSQAVHAWVSEHRKVVAMIKACDGLSGLNPKCAGDLNWNGLRQAVAVLAAERVALNTVDGLVSPVLGALRPVTGLAPVNLER